jgi:hypothetical protein
MDSEVTVPHHHHLDRTKTAHTMALEALVDQDQVEDHGMQMTVTK